MLHAWPDRYWQQEFELAPGATVADALAAAAESLQAAQINWTELSTAIFGRAVNAATRLEPGDRVELLRPLQLSPQEARSARAAAAKRGARK